MSLNSKGGLGDSSDVINTQLLIFDGDDGAVDSVYQAKARILNAAIQEIGMGKYQWHLFIVTGFGWFSGDIWGAGCISAFLINPVVAEFPGLQGPFLIIAQCVGLLAGSLFWGFGSDIWGRRITFNATLLVTGAFVLIAGGAPNPTILATMIALWSFGAGGGLPVDSAVFLEFVPATHQWLLTTLSIWWAFGQLVSSLVAWPLIANFSCASASHCPRSSNMGWRYLLWAMGGVNVALFVLRFFVFHLYESPKYLIGRGRDADAVTVIQKLAHYNGTTTALNIEMLKAVESDLGESAGNAELKAGAKQVLTRKFRIASTHVQALFATRKLGFATTLLIMQWGLIGLAFTLYNGFIVVFLQTRGADLGDGSTSITYRNQSILAVMGIPGSLLAGWMVEMPYMGRKGTLAISTVLTGALLLASTTSRTSDALLGWNCAYSFTNNIMFGVLYAVSPEIFPAKYRGTGNALVNSAGNVAALLAPIIALYANLSTSVPIYISGALFVLSGIMALLLPFEPRGKASI